MGGSSSFGGRNVLGGNTENVALATYARCVLKQICSQPWVHQRCLQNPEELLKPDGLLDSCLSFRQAQRLLQMISRPDSAGAAEDFSNVQPDYRKMVNRVLENLDQWRLRVAWLDLQLLCQQLTPSGNGGGASTAAEMNQLLDAVARAVLDVFELSQPANIKEESDPPGGVKKRAESSVSGAVGSSSSSSSTSKPYPALSISLIAPLVSKLPGTVQGRILKVASQVHVRPSTRSCSIINDHFGSGTGELQLEPSVQRKRKGAERRIKPVQVAHVVRASALARYDLPQGTGRAAGSFPLFPSRPVVSLHVPAQRGSALPRRRSQGSARYARSLAAPLQSRWR